MTPQEQATGQIEAIFAEHVALASRMRDECLYNASAAGTLILETLDRGATIFICGNGGSAADAQHFAAELTGYFINRRRRALPSIALTTDTSAITAIANDTGFEGIFARQIDALARPGDLLIGISTSGRSKNVVAALETAYNLGLSCIGLCGADPSTMAPLCQHVVSIPHAETARIQEMHILVLHSWCALIEAHFAPR